jgi:hypothetical protein
MAPHHMPDQHPPSHHTVEAGRLSVLPSPPLPRWRRGLLFRDDGKKVRPLKKTISPSTLPHIRHILVDDDGTHRLLHFQYPHPSSAIGNITPLHGCSYAIAFSLPTLTMLVTSQMLSHPTFVTHQAIIVSTTSPFYNSSKPSQLGLTTSSLAFIIPINT